MNLRKIFFSCVFAIAASTFLFAQDAHFSQFYEAPLLLNPSRAGFINGTYQLSGVYKSQWTSADIPFKTINGTLNLNVPAGKNKNNIFGIAFSDFADKAGDASYTTNHFDGTLSFHKNFGTDFNQYIGAGITGSFASTTFDYSKLIFDENFMNGINSESIGTEKANYTDLAIGAEYNFLNDDRQWNGGIAVYHLFKPTVSYSGNGESTIYRKYVLNFGYAKEISSSITAMPKAAAFIQGPSKELILGGDVKFDLTQNSTTNYAIYAGVYYRVGDALIPKFRIDMGDLCIGFSYDFTTSGLAEISNSKGGPELSLIYKGRVKGISAGRIYNPRF
ncbi:MAG: PorP/SprF family type IX secretion system membrane protein [Chitinophagales bacterium]|nr:PorP/SprF family type IX secretion system membrane protein [Chitinophagales bacterium]